MVEIENPKCCNEKTHRSYAKEKIGSVKYFDVVYTCKKCGNEYFVTLREIEPTHESE